MTPSAGECQLAVVGVRHGGGAQVEQESLEVARLLGLLVVESKVSSTDSWRRCRWVGGALAGNMEAAG